MMIDLHLHSKASDGSDTPSQLIDQAIELKLGAIAITDHDTISGVKEFLFYGESKKIIIIPGIEISISHEPKRQLIDVHIIGLNIDHTSTKLINTINNQIKGRLEQKKVICTRLREEFGYKISFEEVQSLAGTAIVGRPHIVEIMMRNNPEKVKGKTKNELFKMISIGGAAFVNREVELNFEESIE
ncbi:MAG: PHP domain-containing protein, partial [Candidatus Odinarchaeota archaeon]